MTGLVDLSHVNTHYSLFKIQSALWGNIIRALAQNVCLEFYSLILCLFFFQNYVVLRPVNLKKRVKRCPGLH